MNKPNYAKSGAIQFRLHGKEWDIFGPFDIYRCITQRYGYDETIQMHQGFSKMESKFQSNFSEFSCI